MDALDAVCRGEVRGFVMTIRVSVLAKSVAPSKKVLTTFELYYPRAMLHEEFLTHRALSKNASSSRATTIQAMIEAVRNDPAMPLYWGINGKGMSDHGIMTGEDAERCKREWLSARDSAVRHVGNMMKMNPAPHKQDVNILLRPWEHITVVVSGTEWDNFYALRTHKDAKPVFQALAKEMWRVDQATEAKPLQPGEWHLPYIWQHELDALAATKPEKRDEALGNLIKVSAARCARTSYKNHRGKVATFAEDVELYERLAGGNPKHASPLEHQGTPDVERITAHHRGGKTVLERSWENPKWHGNFVGWVQHRKTIAGENITKFEGIPT
jgi:hypothetical protein